MTPPSTRRSLRAAGISSPFPFTLAPPRRGVLAIGVPAGGLLALRVPAGGLLALRVPAGCVLALGVLLAFVCLAGLPAPASAAPPEKFAGTWRIDAAQQLEQQGFFHFFYLHPSGRFLLAAEWPGHETSRFAGHWSVTGDKLYLAGQGEVETNQGNWKVEFNRTFTIVIHDTGLRIVPLPEKNRFGMMGWPNGFQYHRQRPVPNLPTLDLPPDEATMLERINELAPETGAKKKKK